MNTNGTSETPPQPPQPPPPPPPQPATANPTPEVQLSRRRNKRHHRFTEHWQSPLFSCFEDLGLCLTTCLCPCVAAGLLSEFTDTASCAAGCCLSLVPCIGCFYLCLARTKVRELHHIGGTLTRDLAASFLVPFCVLTQAQYEVDMRPSQLINRFWFLVMCF